VKKFSKPSDKCPTTPTLVAGAGTIEFNTGREEKSTIPILPATKIPRIIIKIRGIELSKCLSTIKPPENPLGLLLWIIWNPLFKKVVN
jgi:hypothetical protein